MHFVQESMIRDKDMMIYYLHVFVVCSLIFFV